MSRTIVLLCCASVAACGGTEGTPKGTPVGAVTSSDSCATAMALTQMALADFENGPPPGLSVTSDNSMGSMIDPDSSHTDPYPASVERCGISQHALHVVASKLSDWGANIELDFKNTTDGIDATDFDGLSFWVRRGDNSSGRSMLSLVLDPFTAPPFDTSMMPYCGDGMTEQDKCDPYGHAVGFDEEWSFFPVPFSAMRQKGYGKPSPALDKKELLGFKFSLGVGDWDLWVDDIAFYKAKP